MLGLSPGSRAAMGLGALRPAREHSTGQPAGGMVEGGVVGMPDLGPQCPVQLGSPGCFRAAS